LGYLGVAVLGFVVGAVLGAWAIWRLIIYVVENAK
jgi:hypothetical protein